MTVKISPKVATIALLILSLLVSGSVGISSVSAGRGAGYGDEPAPPGG